MLNGNHTEYYIITTLIITVVVLLDYICNHSKHVFYYCMCG